MANERGHISGLSTTNKSFQDMHIFLKEKNIRNNGFMLELNDTTLQSDIDRYLLDTGGTIPVKGELKTRIEKECLENPWFFFREILQIPSQGGGSCKFKINPISMSMIWLHQNNISYLAESQRQTSRTTTNVAILLYELFCEAMTDSHIYDIYLSEVRSTSIILRRKMEMMIGMSSILLPKLKKIFNNSKIGAPVPISEKTMDDIFIIGKKGWDKYFRGRKFYLNQPFCPRDTVFLSEAEFYTEIEEILDFIRFNNKSLLPRFYLESSINLGISRKAEVIIDHLLPKFDFRWFDMHEDEIHIFTPRDLVLIRFSFDDMNMVKERINLLENTKKTIDNIEYSSFIKA